MKKLICLTSAALALTLSLTACGGNQNPQVTEPEPTMVITGATMDEATPKNSLMLLSTANSVAELQGVKREHYENGGYYYLDLSEDKSVRCVSSCYSTSIKEGESEEEYAQRRAVGLSMSMTPGTPSEITCGMNDKLSAALGAPVYLVTYVTGSSENPVRWTVYLHRDQHFSFQYAFCTPADADMEAKILNYFHTLKLEQMPS